MITLAYHVDYWNHLGWKDPFGHKQYSERQQAACEARRSTRAYTPMLMVQGGVDTADPTAAMQELRRIRGERAELRLEISASIIDAREKDTSDEHLKVKVFARIAPIEKLPPGVQLFVAIAEDGLSTRCTAGENQNRTLAEGSVVRHLGWLEKPKAEQRLISRFHKEWARENLRVVVFLQDPKTWEVLQVAECRL